MSDIIEPVKDAPKPKTRRRTRAKPKAITKPKASIVQPNIKIAGHLNAFEQKFDQGTLPLLKAVGCLNIDPLKKHQWVNYIITFQGEKIISIEVSEPNMRAIAQETAKIDFVTLFMDQD